MKQIDGSWSSKLCLKKRIIQIGLELKILRKKKVAETNTIDRTVLNLRLNIRCTIVALKCLHPLVSIPPLLNLIFVSLSQTLHFTTAGILLVRHTKSP